MKCRVFAPYLSVFNDHVNKLDMQTDQNPLICTSPFGSEASHKVSLNSRH
jgi:hypothetical protein